MKFAINLSKISNPIGVEFSIDEQIYVAIAVEDRKITFKSNCPTCSEEFTCWAMLDNIHSPNRRCEKHRAKGVRVKPRKPRNKRVAAVAQDPLDAGNADTTVTAELRKMRAAGKTIKQLVKWAWDSHNAHFTTSEIWQLVRNVEIAPNVTPIFRLRPRRHKPQE